MGKDPRRGMQKKKDTRHKPLDVQIAEDNLLPSQKRIKRRSKAERGEDEDVVSRVRVKPILELRRKGSLQQDLGHCKGTIGRRRTVDVPKWREGRQICEI